MNAQAHIADTLNRAQRCWDEMLATEPTTPPALASNLFIHHIVTAVLLENLRRLDPARTDQLTAWMLREDGIFEDGYAGELLYEWQQQLAAGQPLKPIGPDSGATT